MRDLSLASPVFAGMSELLNFAVIGKRIEAARSVAEGNEGYRTAESLAAFYAVSPDSLKKNYCCVSDKSFFLL